MFARRFLALDAVLLFIAWILCDAIYHRRPLQEEGHPICNDVHAKSRSTIDTVRDSVIFS